MFDSQIPLVGSHANVLLMVSRFIGTQQDKARLIVFLVYYGTGAQHIEGRMGSLVPSTELVVVS